MELRRNIRGCFSPTLFALVGLAFFLTFATISYGDAQTTFTGAQLVTQTVPRGGTANDDYTCSGEVSDCVHGGGSAKATIVLLAAALGSLLAAFGIRGAGLCTVVGLGATLALASPVLELFAGPSMDFGRGYVATLLLLLAASAVGIVRSVFDRMDFPPPRPSAGPVRLLVTVFWICVCSILLAGYDFAPTSRFAFGLFVALLGIVALFAVRLIREWISPPRAAERQASVQG